MKPDHPNFGGPVIWVRMEKKVKRAAWGTGGPVPSYACCAVTLTELLKTDSQTKRTQQSLSGPDLLSIDPYIHTEELTEG